jgi:2-oxoglutarate ferredoxin oxidoreductase subunit gamma
MNQQAAERYIEFIEQKGLAIANSTLCRLGNIDWNFIGIQATKIADQLGNVKAANLVMLGAMLARKSVISLAKMEDTIRNSFTGLARPITNVNLHAFYWGLSI